MKKFLIISLIMIMCICFTTLTISAAPDNRDVAASGDVNGDMYLDIKDVTLMQKYLIETADKSQLIMSNFDFNGDGINDIADGTALQKYITKYGPIYLEPTGSSTASTKATDTVTFPVVIL